MTDQSQKEPQKAAPPPRRGPRKLTRERLEAAALHYLERFASTAANLRRVLRRRVRRSAELHGTDPDEGNQWVDALVARYVSAGLVDDAAYAQGKAASLARRGTSRQGIAARLRQKGVEAAQIDQAIGDIEGGDLAAAATLARRRRLGPYRPAETRDANRLRDLGVLARAGFSRAIALSVLEAADPEAVEALLRDAE
jgi:regulatory protein